jgi:hypothetical protein
MRILVTFGMCILLAACANGIQVRDHNEFCAACQGESQTEASQPGSATRQHAFGRGEQDDSLFNFSLSTRDSVNDGAGTGSGGGIGVNSYLWRASLDTLAFIPLATADPFGGVIISDWYVPPDVRDERFKVSVFILDRQLRADGIRATVFKQTLSPQNGWIDAAVGQNVPIELENAILTRAREIRVGGG